MKQIFAIVTAASLAAGCSGTDTTHHAGNNAPAVEETATPSAGDDAAVRVTVSLPEPLLTGPIDPVWGLDEPAPLLMAAYLGHYATVEEMRSSPFYPALQSAYPMLDGIDAVAVETGSGDLWLLSPIEENTSLAINEYDLDMFNGVRPAGDGAVLLRTEQAVPVVVRMTAYAPGQVSVTAVGNDGRVMTWIPTLAPATNELNAPADGMVAVSTLEAVSMVAEYGTDYACDLGGGHRATLRFYANGEVSVNGALGHYMAYHLAGNPNAVGLWLADGQGRQTAARLTRWEQDPRVFNLEVLDGYDLGLDATLATFVPE